MSPTPIAEQAEQALNGQRERRLRQRYPIALPLQYKVVGHVLLQGSGRTVNVSSGGILMDIGPAGIFSARQKIEVSVDWPFLLDGSLTLKLRATGHVVRNHSGSIAIEFIHYEIGAAPTSRIR